MDLDQHRRRGFNMKFYNTALEIDRMIGLIKITKFHHLHLKNLLSDQSLRNYFFSHLESTNWFLVLLEHGYFNKLSTLSSKNQVSYTEQYLLCDYLKKMAPFFPNEITQIIKNSKTNNSRLVWEFTEIGILLPPKNIAQLVPNVRKWCSLEINHATNFGPGITKWINYLVQGNEYFTALKLLKILTTLKIQYPSQKRDKDVEKLIGRERKKAVPVMEYYWFKQMLTDGIKSLSCSKPFEAIDILAVSLERALRIEYGYIKPANDLSYIWRAAIEEHSQNFEHYDPQDALVISLRNILELVAKEYSDKTLHILKNFLSHKYSIFHRLAYHILRLNYSQYMDEINGIIKNKELLFDVTISHEYYILLRDVFQEINPDLKVFIIQSIREHERFRVDDKPEIQELQKRFYWLERLHFFEPYLEGETKEFYDSLKQEFKDEKLRDTPVWSESSTGEKSPLNISELEQMDVNDIWKYLKTFKSNKRGIDAPTSEGLARIFGEVVKRSPEKFLTNDLSPVLDLKPNYVYWFVHQIAELWKNDNYYNVEEILTLFSRLMHYENIPDRFTDEWRTNFSGVKRRILDAIQSAIKSHQKTFPLQHKDKILEIIEYLCFYEADPQDSLTTLNKKESLDSFTLSLNSVRGQAMHTLLDYALWYAFHTKDQHTEERPNRLKDEERVIKVLEDKLDKTKDPSLAVHSTFGMFIPYLAYLNYEWLKNNLDKIFPEQKEYWSVAFSGYFYSSRFYTDLFELLRPQFKRAIEYLGQNNFTLSSGFGNRPEESLAEHLIIACLNDLDNVCEKNSLLRKYLKIENNSRISHSIQFIANLAKNEKIFFTLPGLERKEFWSQAKEIWKIRITVAKRISKADKPVIEEEKLEQEFSRYFNWLDDLPLEVTLKEIESLLAETIKLNKRGWHLPDFIEYLSKQSQQYPFEAVKLFDLLLNTKAPAYFYNGKEKEIENILVASCESKIPQAKNLADKIMNRFGEMGNYSFKDLWKKYYYHNKEE